MQVFPLATMLLFLGAIPLLGFVLANHGEASSAQESLVGLRQERFDTRSGF